MAIIHIVWKKTHPMKLFFGEWVVAVAHALTRDAFAAAALSRHVFCLQTATQSNSYPVSNQFMIGDYVIPGNIVLPAQNAVVKSPPL